MLRYFDENARSYVLNDATGEVISCSTNQPVERVWAYPVRQAVWGGVPEHLYFRSAEARKAYTARHDYCDKLPRCKVYSDILETDE